jgi:hypothetical protein
MALLYAYTALTGGEMAEQDTQDKCGFTRRRRDEVEGGWKEKAGEWRDTRERARPIGIARPL